MQDRCDVVVIGAGFGGLGAALRLAEGGARVTVCEALAYPGGCASTFKRSGYRFEAGATLFSGFGPGQLFAGWIARHELPVEVEWLDPLITLRAPGFSLEVPPRRDALVARLAAMPGAPAEGLRRFFAYQTQVADALWGLFDDPNLLPPLDGAALLRHAARSPRYLPLLRAVGRSLEAVLRRFGVEGFEPLRLYLNAVCQITVQVDLERAEAPFALAAMDYCFRGTGHVRGGIGELASALCGAIERLGGRVLLANQVRALRRDGDGWCVEARRGELRAQAVVANLLPGDAQRLLQADHGAIPALDKLQREVEQGWGAVMRYLVVPAPPGADPAPHHLELVLDPAAPFVEGNHVFCSISGADEPGRAPQGLRTVTASTHILNAPLQAAAPAEQAARVQQVQEAMLTTMQRLAPEWFHAPVYSITGSPRTFARFTRRSGGYVGGIPRTRGLHHYTRLQPLEPLPQLFLAGDSAFPGQSTLATALGGARVAEVLLRRGLARDVQPLKSPRSLLGATP